jgi:hypothetical protein
MLARGSFGFRGCVFVGQFPDMMALARTPKNQGDDGGPGTGFAKIESHKVRHISAGSCAAQGRKLLKADLGALL